MPRPLFMGDLPIYSCHELARLFERIPREERAGALSELLELYRTGSLSKWLEHEMGPNTRSKTTGLSFDPLRSGALDPTHDRRALVLLISELAGIAEQDESGDAGASPADEPEDAGLVSADEPPATARGAWSDGTLRRKQCEQYDWYAKDGLDELEDWSSVACSDDELREILLRVSRERARGAGDRGPEREEPVTIHVCNVDEGPFDILSARFPHTRFVGHGDPTLRITDLLAQAVDDRMTLDLASVDGLSFEGSLTLHCRADLEIEALPGQLGPGCGWTPRVHVSHRKGGMGQ